LILGIHTDFQAPGTAVGTPVVNKYVQPEGWTGVCDLDRDPFGQARRIYIGQHQQLAPIATADKSETR
jgi:hypothetical protein